MAETISKQMTLLPEYQERYLKDLLANVFQVDEESGTISGIASQSPLYGKPVYQKADGSTTLDETEAAVGADGNPVQYYQTADGSYTLEINDASRDQFGEPIFAVEGGVAAPDVMRFTDAQTDAIRRLTGYTDPETEEVYLILKVRLYMTQNLTQREMHIKLSARMLKVT